MCLVAGAVVKLSMGIEPAFYVDCGPPTYAFSPCGHMATEKTVKLVTLIANSLYFKYVIRSSAVFSFIHFSLFSRYWEKVAIPHGTNGYIAICPFCAVPLEGTPGYVKLIFQDNVD